MDSKIAGAHFVPQPIYHHIHWAVDGGRRTAHPTRLRTVLINRLVAQDMHKFVRQPPSQKQLATTSRKPQSRFGMNYKNVRPPNVECVPVLSFCQTASHFQVGFQATRRPPNGCGHRCTTRLCICWHRGIGQLYPAPSHLKAVRPEACKPSRGLA